MSSLLKLIPSEIEWMRLAEVPTHCSREDRLLPLLLAGKAAPKLFVKRDDLTGLVTTGNKIRKLNYLVAQALSEGADTLITCGGLQSNHARATAAVAAMRGLSATLFLRADQPPKTVTGNWLLARILGADVRLLSTAEYAQKEEIMQRTRLDLANQGRRAYVIPEGGSNGLGCLGYIRCVGELLTQLPRPERPTTLICAVGSAGTLVGLALGIALADVPWRVVGIPVCENRAFFQPRAEDILRQALVLLKRPEMFDKARTVFDLCDGYVGRGYGQSTETELRLIATVAKTSGLLLDPVYTAKAFAGLLGELRKDSDVFGPRVVFIHTGGLFGLFPHGDELAALMPS